MSTPADVTPIWHTQFLRAADLFELLAETLDRDQLVLLRTAVTHMNNAIGGALEAVATVVAGDGDPAKGRPT